MGSSYKRLALMGAAIAALIVSAAFFGTTSSASAAKKSRAEPDQRANGSGVAASRLLPAIG